MRAGTALVALLLAVMAGPAAAEAPSTSQRPAPRPVATAAMPAPAPVVQAAAAAPVQGGIGASQRPLPRPGGRVAAAPMPAAQAPVLVSVRVAPAGADAPRPLPRPAAMAAAAAPAVAAPVLVSVRVAPAGAGTPRPLPRPGLAAPTPAPEATVASAAAPAPRPERRGGLFGLFGGNRSDEGRRSAPSGEGYVCGDPEIRGEELARITARTRGCGVDEPVRVTNVAGIRLSSAATIDCPTAIALKRWVERGLKPAFRKEIVEIKIAASYICRTRNNRPGAKISEHGRGKAVDVSGLVFADGREISVARDYNREFRKAHRAACGIFGTTLGPGSDGYHEDHLHFDTANHRNGPYCR